VAGEDKGGGPVVDAEAQRGVAKVADNSIEVEGAEDKRAEDKVVAKIGEADGGHPRE
jgi:hypothetical protein